MSAFDATSVVERPTTFAATGVTPTTMFMTKRTVTKSMTTAKVVTTCTTTTSTVVTTSVGERSTSFATTGVTPATMLMTMRTATTTRVMTLATTTAESVATSVGWATDPVGKEEVSCNEGFFGLTGHEDKVPFPLYGLPGRQCQRCQMIMQLMVWLNLVSEAELQQEEIQGPQKLREGTLKHK